MKRKQHLRRIGIVWLCGMLGTVSAGSAVVAEQGHVRESGRRIPLHREVDVVVVGGSSGAVAAALEAAKAGAKVFVAAPCPYLGEDMAGTLRLWLEDGETPQRPLAKALYASRQGSIPSPGQVKRVFDKALMDARIEFLTGTYVGEVLVDEAGAVCGVVMSNRSGRQAIKARVVIDATADASVARVAGAGFTDPAGGVQTFSRIVVAKEAPSAAGMTVTELPGDFSGWLGKAVKEQGSFVKAYLCVMTIALDDASFRSLAAAQQIALDRTFVKGLFDGADRLFQVPPVRIQSMKAWAGAWDGVEKLDLACLVPAGVKNLFVLGGCADMGRDAAERLLRPLAFMEVGTLLGRRAAVLAKTLPTSAAPRVRTIKADGDSRIEVKEALAGVRPTLDEMKEVVSGDAALPVLGRYDVVVVGAGTSGAPAAIAAGRQGARTLVIEYLNGMGGISTLGMIGNYWFGNVCGFTDELDRGVKELGASVHVVGKAEWLRRECRKAGVEIWFGAMGTGALIEGTNVVGVVVATSQGRGVVLARNVVDATGNSDIAAAAGAECHFVGAEELAVQGVGLSPRALGISYSNSDFGYVNDSDALDLCLFGVRGRALHEKGWDASQLVESRERRRIKGDGTVTFLDILNKRTFPDTIVQSRSNFDSHGYTVTDVSYIEPQPKRKVLNANLPYRSLLPVGIENLLVAGLGMNAHRDAMPILRMQPDLQNQGYAAGTAAAMASKAGTGVRTVEIRKLQAHLVEKKIIPATVLTWQDSYPASDTVVRQAVSALTNQYAGAGFVFANPQQALPLLKSAYVTATTVEARRVYAHVLGMLGDATGAETLVATVAAARWEGGWSFRGGGQFGRSVSMLDSYLIALGRTQVPQALAAVLDKAIQLDATKPFSNFRSVTLALESLGEPAAAKVLAGILGQPGMGGHARSDLQAFGKTLAVTDSAGNVEREACLRELALARALYRCGDHNGLAEEILRCYAKDPRGVYALHAMAVLKNGPGRKGRGQGQEKR